MIPELGFYNPVTNRIRIDINELRNYPCWHRQVIALWIHELVHAIQWHIICRHNTDMWNSDSYIKQSEIQADYIQDIVLQILCCKLTKGYK